MHVFSSQDGFEIHNSNAVDLSGDFISL
jgi:hypothetical protein